MSVDGLIDNFDSEVLLFWEDIAINKWKSCNELLLLFSMFALMLRVHVLVFWTRTIDVDCFFIFVFLLVVWWHWSPTSNVVSFAAPSGCRIVFLQRIVSGHDICRGRHNVFRGHRGCDTEAPVKCHVFNWLYTLAFICSDAVQHTYSQFELYHVHLMHTVVVWVEGKMH